MAYPPEALSYFLKFRDDFPDDIEPTPENLINDIVNFCRDGLFDASGHHRLDEDGAEITGSIEWLIGMGVTKANFYTAIQPVPMLFCLLSEIGSSNWTQLPGFMLFVETDPVIINPGDITLTSQTALDERFQQRLAEIQKTP